MDIQKDNSLVINNFQEGIGQSPLARFSDMMGLDLKQPGLAGVNTKFEEFTFGYNKDRDEQTFTVSTSTNEITLPNNASIKGQLITRPFKVSSSGTLPAGLTAGTIYFAATDTSGRIFKVATSIKKIQDADYVNITSTGSGTHTLKFINIEQVIGWTYNDSGRIMLLSTDINSDNNYVWQMDFISTFPILVPGNSQSGFPKGIVSYKGYTLVFRSNGVDALKEEGVWNFNEPVWTNGFDDITISVGGSYIKPFYSMNDDCIFFYNGLAGRKYYKIGLLEEIAGQTFNPANTDTFDFVADAVTIPFENFNAYPTAINELNEYLVIGTYGNKIYFWDKRSPSFTSFIEIKDNLIVSIEIIDNMAYCITEEGKIYVTNITSAQLVNQIPEHLKPFQFEYIGNRYTRVTAVEKYKEKILMGVNIDLGGSFPNQKFRMYIFEYDTNTNQINKFGITSFGEELTFFGNSQINSIFVDKFSGYGDNISTSVTYYDDTDNLDTFKYNLDSNIARRNFSQGSARFIGYNNYEAYATTGLISYGSVHNKQTLRNIEVNFAQPLSQGQGIKLYYRRNLEDNFTLWKTIDFATYGAIKEIKVEAPLTDILDLQVRVNISCYNGESSGNTYFSPTFKTPYLKSIRLIP